MTNQDNNKKNGRPPFFSNPKLLEQGIQNYFEWINGEYEIKQGVRTSTDKKGVVTTETFEYKE
jgi:hypothetical protein